MFLNTPHLSYLSDDDVYSSNESSLTEGGEDDDDDNNNNIDIMKMETKKPEKKEKDLTPITCIAVDPGIVHHAIIRMSLHGFEYSLDPTTNTMIKLPKVKVHNWEHWSLKHKITYRADEDWKLKTNKYDGEGVSTEDKIKWHENLAHFVASADWLFEKDDEGKLPRIVSELQCGYIKNEEVDAYTISHILPAAIKTADIVKGLGGDRLIVNSAKKYGIPSDGSLSYTERKRMSDDVTYNILNKTSHKPEVSYLNLTLLAQKRDSIPRVKTDDMSDAFTLGLEYLSKQWELREYNEDNSIKLEDDPVRVFIFDEEEDEKILTQKQRVRRKPAAKKKNNNNNNNNNVEEDQEKEGNNNVPVVVKKKQAAKKSTPKRKRNVEYEDEVEEEFLQTTRKKKKLDLS